MIVLIHVCIGGLYAWSEFVPALINGYALSTAQTQLVFGCLIMVFTLSMIVAGRLMGRLGPRSIAAIGGILFGGGYFVASRSSGDFGLLLFGISGLAGIGTGFCYVCPIALCAKWFPQHKGFATGLAVAGFGGGAVLLAQLAKWMLAGGLDVLDVFGRVGLLYGGIILLAALPLRFPDSTDGNSASIEFAIMARDRYFWGLFSGIFAGTFAGLLVIGNLKPMLLSKGIDPTVATVAISAFAVGNTAGRIVWGWVADRIETLAIPLSLALLSILLGLAIFLQSSTGAIGLSVFMGMGFGACFVVYAARVSSHYGASHIASIYPLVFLGYGLSGLLGPWAGGWIYDSTGSYQGGLVVGVIVVIFGLGLSHLLLRTGGLKNAEIQQ
jgi:OFA family oxalate/formate antiporter-like MFS transporter